MVVLKSQDKSRLALLTVSMSDRSVEKYPGLDRIITESLKEL